MSYRIIILSLFISITFSQTQVVIVEEMFMDAPYVGEFTTTNTKYASDNLFKQEMQIEVGSFLVRMAMGGNKKVGSIIDGNSKLRSVYDIDEEEYAEENFKSILENDGIPKLKMMDNAFGGGSRSNSNESENEDSSEDNESENNDVDNNEVIRTINDNYEKIGEFLAKKVITEMMGRSGRVVIEEWFTMDTSLFRYALDIESKLVSAYGGSAQTTPRSFSEPMLRSAGHEFESVEGRLVKYKMTQKDDDDGFKMSWEIKQATKGPFNQSDFILSKDYKKVDELN
tara:strand:+ start:343 stop:1194 length:852 start_codon:yes stop_codon:yes gene_type:complete